MLHDMIFAFDNSYRDGLRLQKEGTINTLTSKMGTGGNNVPFVAIPIQETTHEIIGTLQSRSYKGPNHEAARDGQLIITKAIPIQDGRGMEKKQNGFGVGNEGDPSYTLDQTGGQSVAFPIQGTVVGRQDHNGPAGKGYREENSPMFTLDSYSRHGVATEMQVRRLTPLECERLMGWPDNHTLHRSDGKKNSDTHRYKMCGNGVASPVAQWIGEQILMVHKTIND